MALVSLFTSAIPKVHSLAFFAHYVYTLQRMLASGRSGSGTGNEASVHYDR